MKENNCSLCNKPRKSKRKVLSACEECLKNIETEAKGYYPQSTLTIKK